MLSLPQRSLPATLLSLLLLISCALSTTTFGGGKLPFRQPGSDTLNLDFTPPFYDHVAREQFTRDLAVRIASFKKSANMYDTHQQLLRDYRRDVLRVAQQNLSIVNGAGAAGALQLNLYARELVTHYVQTMKQLKAYTLGSQGSVYGMAALAFTDEMLSVFEMLMLHFPDIHFPALRSEIDSGLIFLEALCRQLVPSAYLNGLAPQHLITLSTSLSRALNSRRPQQQTINRFSDFREHIDSVLTSYSITTPYPKLDMNPDSMITPELKQERENMTCWPWPWRVDSQSRNYYICTDTE